MGPIYLKKNHGTDLLQNVRVNLLAVFEASEKVTQDCLTLEGGSGPETLAETLAETLLRGKKNADCLW